MGHMHYLAASSSGGGSYTFLIVIVVLFGLLYFVMIRPQRNKQRAGQRHAEPGPARSAGSHHGGHVRHRASTPMIRMCCSKWRPGVQIRFLRRAVLDVLPDDDGMAGTDARGPPTLP